MFMNKYNINSCAGVFVVKQNIGLQINFVSSSWALFEKAQILCISLCLLVLETCSNLSVLSLSIHGTTPTTSTRLLPSSTDVSQGRSPPVIPTILTSIYDSRENLCRPQVPANIASTIQTNFYPLRQISALVGQSVSIQTNHKTFGLASIHLKIQYIFRPVRLISSH